MKKYLKELMNDRSRLAVLAITLFVIVLSLWIGHPKSHPRDNQEELGVVIPSGQVIIPISLSNTPVLDTLITRYASIDVFKQGRNQPLVENLHIMKLSAGEGPLFGALVPEDKAGNLQDLFADSRLRGAMRRNSKGAPIFHLRPVKSVTSILEVPIGE